MDCRLFHSRNVRPRARVCVLVVAGLALMAVSGCALMQKCGCGGPPEPPPPVNKVDTLWQQEVSCTPNTHDGKLLPGVFGRVWLYREGSKLPVEANGTLEIWMYDLTPMANGAPPVQLASWRFNPNELSQLKHGDMVGTGYSLFLPLDIYRPEIKQVRISVAFVDDKGTRTAGPPDIVLLRPDQRMLQMQSQVRPIVPASVK